MTDRVTEPHTWERAAHEQYQFSKQAAERHGGANVLPVVAFDLAEAANRVLHLLEQQLGAHRSLVRLAIYHLDTDQGAPGLVEEITPRQLIAEEINAAFEDAEQLLALQSGKVSS